MAGSAGEKTEKATPKKRQDARKKGQVLKSSEVNTAVTTMAMFATLMMLGGYIFRGMMQLLSEFLGARLGEKITEAQAPNLVNSAIWELIQTILPLLGVALVAGVLANVAQVGFLFTGAPLKPKFSKINPFQGFKRIFSMRSAVEMIKAILKIGVVGFIVYSEYMANFDRFPQMMTLSVGAAGQMIFDICLSVAFKAGIALVVIGVVDYLYQWRDYEKNLRMTKQEIKDEYKMVEGDPQVKGKIKQKQREMSMMRMMQSVPEADVVITNPTHFAVALKYDDKVAAAPVVVAKGQDRIAQRIKDKARESGVRIVENKPVAQALFFSVEVGKTIPEELFQAVAEILAYVFNQKNKSFR